MPFRVTITEHAERDLEDIVEYIAAHDSPAKAMHVLDKLEQTIAGLSELPNRGAHPRELLELGIRSFRQIFFKRYRVIYGVVGDLVHVYLVADGRRDMKALLERRLLS